MGDIAQELTCTVCLEIYREPHVLPCGHSFCLPCVRDLQHALGLRCPECRREIRDPGAVRKNHKLANIVDAYLEQRTPLPQAAGAGGTADQSERRVAYWLLLTAVLLLFTTILLKQELEATTEELLDSQLQLTLRNEDSVASADLEPVGFGGTLLNLLLSLPRWAMWLLLKPFLIAWDLLWWLLSAAFHLLCLCLRLTSSSLTLFCEFLFNLFNMVVYTCGMAYIYLWALRLLRRRTDQ